MLEDKRFTKEEKIADTGRRGEKMHAEGGLAATVLEDRRCTKQSGAVSALTRSGD